jgi:hypothetical protein
MMLFRSDISVDICQQLNPMKYHGMKAKLKSCCIDPFYNFANDTFPGFCIIPGPIDLIAELSESRSVGANISILSSLKIRQI